MRDIGYKAYTKSRKIVRVTLQRLTGGVELFLEFVENITLTSSYDLF